MEMELCQNLASIKQGPFKILLQSIVHDRHSNVGMSIQTLEQNDACHSLHSR